MGHDERTEFARRVPGRASTESAPCFTTGPRSPRSTKTPLNPRTTRFEDDEGVQNNVRPNVAPSALKKPSLLRAAFVERGRQEMSMEMLIASYLRQHNLNVPRD